MAQRVRHVGPVTVDLLRRMSQEVFQSLGVGHSERVYHRGMIAVLNSNRIFHRSEVTAPIYMHDEVVGVGRADLVVGKIAVEIKVRCFVLLISTFGCERDILLRFFC